MLFHHRFGVRHLGRSGDLLRTAPGFPYDDPAWNGATDAYLKTDTRDLLQEITELWNDDTADYLFFSSLLHQNTIYSATFLALPHIVALADTLPPDHRRTFTLFLAGVAQHGQRPATSGGVSLAAGEPWASTPTGQRAGEVFRALLSDIGRLCEQAYREDPIGWYAAGMAAARGDLDLADRLETYDGLVPICPHCGTQSPDPLDRICPRCGWNGPMFAP